jgi:hypothetical protein
MTPSPSWYAITPHGAALLDEHFGIREGIRESSL